MTISISDIMTASGRWVGAVQGAEVRRETKALTTVFVWTSVLVCSIERKRSYALWCAVVGGSALNYVPEILKPVSRSLYVLYSSVGEGTELCTV